MHYWAALTCLSLACTTTFAKGSHGHDHGSAKLDVAVEDKIVNIRFESPSASIYGFEHEPKNEKQTKARDAAVAILKDQASILFKFDDKFGCNVVAGKVDPSVQDGLGKHDAASKSPADAGQDTKKTEAQAPAKKHSHNEHSETQAEYVATCLTSPAGSSLTVELFANFPKLKRIQVQVVKGGELSGMKLNKKNKVVKL